MYKVLDKVKDKGLTNLKMICNDAIELNEYFKENEVSRIYLNFSDPWPKKTCKTSFNVSNFLALYEQILKEDGEIHFKTDNRGLFAYSLESMSQYGMYFTKLNLNLHDEDDEDNILTEYEKNFLIKVPVFIEWKPNFIKLINNILNQHTSVRRKYILTLVCCFIIIALYDTYKYICAKYIVI